jgi:hypothetical protein
MTGRFDPECKAILSVVKVDIEVKLSKEIMSRLWISRSGAHQLSFQFLIIYSAKIISMFVSLVDSFRSYLIHTSNATLHG